jgi:gamma-glutamyltranspeptidase/glutathione hydrolase
MKKTLIIIVFFAFFVSITIAQKSPYKINKELVTDSAMVVSAHPLASEAGKEILKKGGNAIDAMVAVHFVLAVVYQRAGNIGGGGFLLYRDAKGGKYALDFREKAPLAAKRDMYLDTQGKAIDSLSRDGHLAVAVPGSVAGIFEAHLKYGKLPWADLIEPAIYWAKKGFLLTEKEADILNAYRNDFKKLNHYLPVFYNKNPWKKGDRIVQKDLAQTLTRIQKQGAEGFYKGKTAELIEAEMIKGKGILTLEDLAAYQPVWRKPIEFTYRNQYNIITMPPSSSGGVILAEMMQMAENYPLAKMEYHAVSSTHLMAEIEKRAYADRSQHLGDTDFYPSPVEALLEKTYAKSRMSDFSYQKATASQDIKPGQPSKTSEQTTHYSILDKEGNAVAVTTTVNNNFGSRVVVQHGGFILNNEMDDFSAKPGSPNLFGLIGAEANAIAPSKRMLSSMTPTLVEKDKQLFLVLGTPGGSTITTTIFQVLTQLIDYNFSLFDAIQNPRFHHQWLPDRIDFEKDCFSIETQKKLQEMGHQLREREPIGRVDAIQVLPNRKKIGVGDRRGDDSASGY